MTTNLFEEIMTRQKLRNKYLKHKTEENLLRKTKMNYYGNLNEKDVRDNKKFWQTVKPFLSNKQ